MKWFSISGIRQEIKKVRWPKRDELLKDSTVALLFMLAFAAYFVFADFIVSMVLRFLGVIA